MVAVVVQCLNLLKSLSEPHTKKLIRATRRAKPQTPGWQLQQNEVNKVSPRNGKYKQAGLT